MSDDSGPGEKEVEVPPEVTQSVTTTTRQARMDQLTEKAIKIVEQAMDCDDTEFATKTALALLRIVKGGGIGGASREDPGNGRSGDGDDPTGEMDVPDGNVWAGARDRFEGEHKQERR